MNIKVESQTKDCKNVAEKEKVIAHLIGEELQRIGAIKYEHKPDMTDKVLRITGKFEVNSDMEVNDMKCPQCGEYKTPHRVCGNCGYYNGREVVKEA